MLEGTMLRAKTESSEGAYRRELRELGRLRSIEHQSLARVKEKERLFWHEVARSRAATPHQAGAAPARSEERLLQAHRDLKEAIDAHGAARKGREEGSARSVRAEAMVTTCRTLMHAERRRDASRREGRQGEEISEVGAFLRAGVGAGTRGESKEGLKGAAASQPISSEALAHLIAARCRRAPRDSLSETSGAPCGGQGAGGEPLRAATSPAVHSSSFTASAPSSTHTSSDLRFGALQVEAARVERTPHGASLSLECSSIARAGPVRIVVATGGGEGISVTVTALPGESLSALVRERTQVMARLSAAGIRVSRLQIEADTGAAAPGLEQRPQRRRKGSEDEDRIA